MATGAEWRGRLALVAAAVILVVWTISFVLDVAIEGYDPPASVTPLSIGAVGFLFGSDVMTRLAPKPPAKDPTPEETTP